MLNRMIQLAWIQSNYRHFPDESSDFTSHLVYRALSQGSKDRPSEAELGALNIVYTVLNAPSDAPWYARWGRQEGVEWVYMYIL